AIAQAPSRTFIAKDGNCVAMAEDPDRFTAAEGPGRTASPEDADHVRRRAAPGTPARRCTRRAPVHRTNSPRHAPERRCRA
ncbi:hypothetical protein, partial [Streptomyces sp. NPDC045470]